MEQTKLLEFISRVMQSGDIEVQLAERYLFEHCWGKAVMTLERAVSRNTLEDRQHAYLLLSNAYNKLGKEKRAQEWWDKAHTLEGSGYRQAV